MVGEMWRESALISSKWSLSSCTLLTRVYILVMIVTASAAPLQFALDTDGVPIAVEDNFLILNAKDGSYTFAYDTGAGDQQSFRMEVRDASGQVSGRFGYIDPDGALRITNYVADASGYRSTMTVFQRVSRKPTAPSLVVGPVPNELPSLDSIELPPGLQSRHRGRPENILPPEGTPLLIIGPLPRELQPQEIIENKFPDVFPDREDEPIELVRDELVVPVSENNISPAINSDNLLISNSNQSSQFSVSLSLDETSEDSFLQRAFSIQEMQSNDLLISDVRNDADQIFNSPLQNSVSSSVQFNSESDLSSLPSSNVDNKIFVESATQTDILFSKQQNENSAKIDDTNINEISQLHKFSDVVGEDALSIEKLQLESSTIHKPTKSMRLAGAGLNSNIFKISTRVSGSTKLRQIVPDNTVPESKSDQGYSSINSEAPSDSRLNKADVRPQCCDTFDTEKSSSVQVVANLPHPSSIIHKSNYSANKQTQGMNNLGVNAFFDTSNQKSNLEISEKVPQISLQSANSSDNMPSIILRAVLSPSRNNSNMILAYQTEKQPGRPRLGNGNFPYLNLKLPKSNFLRKIFIFF